MIKPRNNYILSQKADQDIEKIYIYTRKTFGSVKARAYLLGLDEHLHHLASNPQIGRKIDFIRRGYYRSNYVSHSIFYKLTSSSIFIVRVLHTRMDIPTRLG